MIQEETGSMKYVVNLKFNEDGTKKFAEATKNSKERPSPSGWTTRFFPLLRLKV